MASRIAMVQDVEFQQLPKTKTHEKTVVAENIKFIRTTNELTQKQFGELLGFSARTVSDWEYGNTEPDIKTIKKMKTIFNLSYEDILN